MHEAGGQPGRPSNRQPAACCTLFACTCMRQAVNQADRRKDSRMNERTDGRADGRIGKCADGCVGGRVCSSGLYARAAGCCRRSAAIPRRRRVGGLTAPPLKRLRSFTCGMSTHGTSTHGMATASPGEADGAIDWWTHNAPCPAAAA
eukprot:366080-Chlamydomonas_euryale.AAC.5